MVRTAAVFGSIVGLLKIFQLRADRDDAAKIGLICEDAKSRQVVQRQMDPCHGSSVLDGLDFAGESRLEVLSSHKIKECNARSGVGDDAMRLKFFATPKENSTSLVLIRKNLPYDCIRSDIYAQMFRGGGEGVLMRFQTKPEEPSQ